MLEIILQLGSLPPHIIAWQLFTNGGWVAFIFLFLLVGRISWLNWRQNKWLAQQEFILLAIDIPQEHEQSVKAVEQIFATLWGSYAGTNFVDKWWDGKFQLPYSIELVSLEGYVQFLIRTPEPYRDLVESAIYAQYPDSEIIEVQDYTSNVPKTFPTDEWDLWGTEFKLAKSDVYPIKTYPQFEHSLNQVFADPLAAMSEVLAKIGPGEQIWLQLVITPINDDWQAKSQKEAKKIIGIKEGGERNFIAKLFAPLIEQVVDILRQGLGLGSEIVNSGDSSPSPMLMANLSPGERIVLEAVQAKATKIGYQTKMRMIYVGMKENFNKARGVSSVIGAIRQYTSLDLNAFKPHLKIMTSANYFRVKQRIIRKQNRILSAFRSRSQIDGAGKGFILNTEELASVWHFPSQEIKAPQLRRSESKVVEPPIGLPVESPLTTVVSPFTVTVSSPDSIKSFTESTQGSAQPGPLKQFAGLKNTQDTESQSYAKPQVTFEKVDENEVVVRPPDPDSQRHGESPDRPPDNLPIG